MDKVVTVSEMRLIEQEADASGLSYAMMMENAGQNLAESIINAYSHVIPHTALALIGPGNNGRDALVCLSHLAERGWLTSAYLIKTRSAEDSLLHRAHNYNCSVYSGEDDNDYQILTRLLLDHAILIDGVLGTGINLPLKGFLAKTLRHVHKFILQHPGALHVVAVDCPSGIDCDTGHVAEETIPAELTVTMAAIKLGLLSFPAATYTGHLQVVGIGDLSDINNWKNINRYVIDGQYVMGTLPPRPRDAHKGTFGTALIVAGSTSYTGAAQLSAQAALRSGVGLVQMAIPQGLHSILAGHVPEATWVVLPQENGFIAKDAFELVLENLPKASAWLIGPGMGLHQPTRDFVECLVNHQSQKELNIPLVIDADGLKHLSSIPGWERKLFSPSILTPHPGEMAILTGHSVQEIQSNRLMMAEKFAKLWGHVVVLKGAYTIVASPDGKTCIIPIATPALAKAGSGDVLAGLIVGLLAQRVDPFEAAASGSWIHAKAGLQLEATAGAISAVAGDLIGLIYKIIIDLFEN